jgi:hypothetical protein
MKAGVRKEENVGKEIKIKKEIFKERIFCPSDVTFLC